MHEAKAHTSTERKELWSKETATLMPLSRSERNAKEAMASKDSSQATSCLNCE